MSKYSKDAQNYLEKVNEIDVTELKAFIDRFNTHLEKYILNGLSSYFLENIEICLKLSKSINYRRGEVLTRRLKGYVLSLGGQYQLSLKSYKKALSLLNQDDPEYGDICCSYAFNYYCIGEFDKSLDLILPVVKDGDVKRVNYILSYILKLRGEDFLSYDIIDNCKNLNNLDIFYKVNSLIDLNRLGNAEDILNKAEQQISPNDVFFSGYSQSIKARIANLRGDLATQETINTILDKLSGRRSMYHYIDGLLNIAELYISLGDVGSAKVLLNSIKEVKGELQILDKRMYTLLELSCLKKDDYQGAYGYKKMSSDFMKCINTFVIDRNLRDVTEFLYKKVSMV